MSEWIEKGDTVEVITEDYYRKECPIGYKGKVTYWIMPAMSSKKYVTIDDKFEVESSCLKKIKINPERIKSRQDKIDKLESEIEDIINFNEGTK